ncbi:MAG: hypothetical protein M1576_04160 [Deltaproteobacteria bacterium]|nr:hypothetical protein [Deltaproteobacteria bacterium]
MIKQFNLNEHIINIIQQKIKQKFKIESVHMGKTAATLFIFVHDAQNKKMVFEFNIKGDLLQFHKFYNKKGINHDKK